MPTEEEIDFSALNWRQLRAAQRAELRQVFIRRAHRLRSEMALVLIFAVASAFGRGVRSLGAAIRRVNEFHAERVAIASLRKLDDAALQDIGIRRAEIESVIQGQGKDDTRRQRPSEGSAERRCSGSSLAA